MVSLSDIVKRYGGDVSASGRQAYMRAPGHSAADRSVSLLLTPEGRLIINCFGPDNWRDIQDMLVQDGFLNSDHYKTRSRQSRSRVRKSSSVNTTDRQLSYKFALDAWQNRRPLEHSRAFDYLKFRRIEQTANSSELAFHPALPTTYHNKEKRRTAPCLIARLSDAHGNFTGIQATYLYGQDFKNKRRLCFGSQKNMRIALTPEVDGMIIGEGLETTASAGLLFKRPALPLLNSGNISRFKPRPDIQNVWIAADNDRAGQEAADEMISLNEERNMRITVQRPTNKGWDWNKVLCASKPK